MNEKRIRQMMTSAFRMLLCASICIWLFLQPALAAPAVEVSLQSDQETELYSFTAMLTVTFSDLSYVKEGQFLSYHVSDSPQIVVEAKSLRYENLRIPLSVDENGKAEVAIAVDVTEFSGKKLYIQYDIVDTVDLFWFSTHSDMEFESAYTTITGSWWQAFFRPVVNAVQNSTFVFILNIIVLIVALIITGIIMKRKLLKF